MSQAFSKVLISDMNITVLVKERISSHHVMHFTDVKHTKPKSEFNYVSFKIAIQSVH